MLNINILNNTDIHLASKCVQPERGPSYTDNQTVNLKVWIIN